MQVDTFNLNQQHLWQVLEEQVQQLLKCIELGKENNINRPELEERVATNFID